jgi:hypothetical protein
MNELMYFALGAGTAAALIALGQRYEDYLIRRVRADAARRHFARTLLTTYPKGGRW